MVQRVDGRVAPPAVQRDALADRFRRVRYDAIVPHVREPRLWDSRRKNTFRK